MKPIAALKIAIFFTACGKNISKVNHEFIGKWTEDRPQASPCGPFVIEITDQGEGHFRSTSFEHECSSGNRNKHDGKALKSGNMLKIGTTFRLTIDEEPFQVSRVQIKDVGGNLMWTHEKMVLGGMTFFKVE